MPTIGINDFVRRQTRASEYTHFEGDLEEVAALALAHFDQAKPGYRDGVCLVPVPPEGFFCGVVTLQEGDELVGRYEARREGEEPRKTVRALRREPKHVVGRRAIQGIQDVQARWDGMIRQGRRAIQGAKSACVAVDVVLYRRDVLEEGDEPHTGCDWDIISINGRFTEDQPIEPMTLIANHFELDGGTATGMTPQEFESALRESVLFWKDKALLAAEKS